jgi:cell division protein FtsB
MGGLIILGDNGLAELKLLKQEHRQMAAENESIARKNSILFGEIKRLREDAGYIESVARQQLGFIGKGEYILKLNHSSEGTP